MNTEVQKTLKDSPAMRWLALLLVSGLMLATYWFQDFFSGLKGMMETQMGFSSEEFGRLIGLTTIANMFGMIIVGGMILDKWGVRIAGLAFGGLAVIGGAITSLAASGFFGPDHSTQLTFMIIGRILFGSGLEVVCVVATTTMVKWFKGYELALAMAINMGFGRLGSAMGIALSPDFTGTVPPAVTFAAALLGVTFIMFVIYVFFDIKLDRQIKRNKSLLATASTEKSEDDEFKFSDLFKLLKNPSFIYIALLCLSFYAAVFPFIQYSPDLLINKFNFTAELPSGGFQLNGSTSLGTAVIYIGLFIFALLFSIVPSKIKSMSKKMLTVALIVGTFAILAYILRDTFTIWFKNGSKTSSLIPLGTIIFTPIFGNYVDKKGKAASLMILGSLLLIFAHVSLSLFNSVILAYLGLFSLGIAFSLVPAAMWPSVAKIVPQSRLGTAYASMFTIQNWGLGLFFWGIGALLQFVNPSVVTARTKINETFDAQGLSTDEISARVLDMKEAGTFPVYDYTIPIFILVISGVISIFLAFKLKQADRKQKYGLELPSGKTA
ncbi:MAG: MFS transporter [Bacteroidota bacterium]|nr:MFS transporter [Bacteroidota bacterium]